MSIFHVKHKHNPYAQIDKTCLEDERLSYRAKGILCYLLSKPPDWTVRVKDISDRGKEGRQSIQTAMKELIQAGYAKIQVIKDDNGKITGKDYWIYETPYNN